ncbi:MAG: hypothetical protein CW338_04670 [Clostridiales bacterium]|nr:hypothetical protein [Clostridiales bacterium]
MKIRMTAFILALVLLLAGSLSAVTALADKGLPQQIASYFSDGDHKDYTILDCVELDSWGSDNCVFVLVRNGKNQNLLYQFKEKDGTWKRQFYTSYAVPQTKHDIMLSIGFDGYEWPTGTPITKPQLSVMQLNADGEYAELCVTYQLEGGKWMLHRIWSYTNWQSMLVKDGAITYYETIESSNVKGTAKGTFQRDIRYINLGSFPKTLKEAREKLTSEPDLPASNELKSQEVKFTGGQSYNVYSAPDAASLRGANGKAKVSTNGWIQVFGKDSGYVLIQYSIDSGHYRFGYIDESSLPKKNSVSDLYFDPMAAWTVGKVTVTDDPLYSRSALAALPDNAPVTWLATLGSWAYIESSSGDLFRGFVPVSSLSTGRTFVLQYLPDSSGRPVWYGELVVYPDGMFEYIAVPAQEGSLGNAIPAALNICDDVTGQLLSGCAGPDEDGTFRGTGWMPSSTTGLLFMTFDPEGNEIGTQIDAQW